jgi:hypothetical protein
MKARVLALLALSATVAMALTAVALAAFGSPETADPERRTGENDRIAPNRQLAAGANGEALWLSETSAAGPGGPVAVYRRCAGGPWPLIRRLGGPDASAAGMAMNPQGDALIVYYEVGAADGTLTSVTRAADGTFGNPEPIATRMQAAIDADGDAVVISHAFPQERAYFRPASTGTWTASEKIEDLPTPPEGYQVEFTGDGRPVAVISGQGRLFASIRGAGGWPDSPTELDSTSSNLLVPLARHGSGVVATWLRRTGGVGTPLRRAQAQGADQEAGADREGQASRQRQGGQGQAQGRDDHAQADPEEALQARGPRDAQGRAPREGLPPLSPLRLNLRRADARARAAAAGRASPRLRAWPRSACPWGA